MTLTELAYYTRNTIKYGILLLISALLLRIFWQAGYTAYRVFFPAPPPAPQNKFGVLPKLIFEKKESANFSFSLQTPEGDLPTEDKLPPLTNIYFMPSEQVSFLNIDEARSVATRLGFSGKELQLGDVVYRFEQPTVPAILDINIVNKTFAVSYNLNKDSELLSLTPTSIPDAISAAKNFLSQSGLFSDDLKEGETSAELLKFQSPLFTKAISLSEANFIRVNFSRKNYEAYSTKKEKVLFPVIGERRDRANVWFLVSGASGPKQIIAGEFHYFPVSEKEKSTYKRKTAKEAWDELVGGRGLIISAPLNQNQIIIRRVYLAYYDSGRAQQFLEPVFVFDGDNNFRAIIPAITPEFYAQ